MGRTHALAGVAAIWVLPTSMTTETLASLTIFAALGALLPDLDANESQIKRLRFAGIMPFTPLALALNRTLGHRGLLHSLLGWGLATLLFSPLLFLPLAGMGTMGLPLALSIGYASHLATDACTKSGIPFFYPRRKRYHLLPRPLRITTGSMAEDIVFAALATLLLTLLVRQLLQNPARLFI